MLHRSQIVARLPADISAVRLPRSGRRWYADNVVAPLRLRASRRGCVWVFQGRTPNGPRRITLGRYPALDLDGARAAATRIATASGAAPNTPITFREVRAAYFDSAEFKRLAQRTQRSYMNVLKGKDYAGLETKRVRQITRQDVLALKDRIATDGRAYQNVLRPLQALLSWAVDRGYLDVSPATRLRLPANTADPRPLDDMSLGKLVRAARAADEPWRTLYLLCAYTGQRTATWCDAKWDEITTEDGRMILTVGRVRGGRSKLGRAWCLPLTETVADLLKALKKAQGRRRNDWLFGRSLVLESKVRAKIAKAAGVTDGTPHRLRSTMLTQFDRWGVPTEVAQRLAGHASPFAGSRGHYVAAAPSPEMWTVIERWENHVTFCTLL